MKTITVKLGGYDLQMFEKLKKDLSEKWIDKATTSEVIRYAIHTGYCFEVDEPKCVECYFERKYSEKKSLTNKSKTAKIKE